ncbi:hypothetical protein AaE_015024 [Aphanomyces astaci]|uniref:Centrosomal protein 20 n=1 Tax=Aphanomyces astaci TaxID=112090 RepID=A0A6A4ZAA9_APHAT|nr:hypothetical protein AaE_015024 [Aphanomyces astaci]
MDGTLSLSDLKDALKDTLEARGSMGQIRARIRAEIFQALDEGAPKAKLSNENLIINELIREYMEYNGYRHALSVFVPESGQPVEKPFHRRFLAHELNITEDPRYTQVPLLYSILTALQDSKHPTDEQHQPPRPPLLRTADRNDDDAQSEHSLIGVALDPSTPRVRPIPHPCSIHVQSAVSVAIAPVSQSSPVAIEPSPSVATPATSFPRASSTTYVFTMRVLHHLIPIVLTVVDRQPPSNPLVVISN